ncbi:FAD-dependent monooxygenase [Pendulispora brunnea]|uniref:FAD-dependent monooxygenase n=1 Tax=Pendulispora brunnea TaxID=2905690 RepID=A0ABZ2K5F1_9BACT
MGNTKAIIVGAGIGGLAAAVSLRRVGIDVEVWEQAPELKAMGTGISVISNAVAALQLLGIDLGLGTIRGAVGETAEILNPKGQTIVTSRASDIFKSQPDAKTVCIHRGDLQAGFLEVAKDTPIHLGAVASNFERDGKGVRVKFKDGREARGDILIGADGIHSVIRRQIHGASPTRYGGFLCWLATVPFKHPRMTPGWSGQYWGTGKRFGLHDIGQGRAYWWGTQTMPEHIARNWKGGKRELARAFEGWAPETRELIEITPDADIVTVPSQDRPFVERWGEGPVTLLGDAAHPMLTSLAQGGSSSIEDAVVLASTLATAPDPVRGLRQYEDQRRERTRWMVETSRKLGVVEQIENPLLVLLRTAFLKLTPKGKLWETFERAGTLPPINTAFTLRTAGEA